MLSTTQQEIFKALSNRTRSKPQDIYQKLRSQITSVEGEVLAFNRREREVPQWLRHQTSRFGPTNALSLKNMTQPKYQHLLLQQQMGMEESTLRPQKRVKQKQSMKYTKDFKSSFPSSMASSQGFSLQPTLVRKFSHHDNVSGKTEDTSIPIESGMRKRAESQRAGRRLANISVTDSVVLPLVPIQEEQSGLASRTQGRLRSQIEKKRKQLQYEWQKTEDYHERISCMIGPNQKEQTERNRVQMARVYQVIDKIRRSRPNSCAIRTETPSAQQSRLHTEMISLR